MTIPQHMFFASNIKYLRHKKNLSQQQLADILQAGRSTLAEYERGKTEPNFETLLSLSNFFEVPVDELLRKDLSLETSQIIKNKELKVLAISIDAQKKGNIELVETKAEAGYLESAQNPEYIKRVSVAVKKAIENKKDIWSECKRGKKNGRWLGYIEMYTPDGRLYKRYETAVDCYHDTGLSKHLIRRKAEIGACMERGYFKNYTFKLVK
jgi:transcriptional regulator with XRE-family HTH domain